MSEYYVEDFADRLRELVREYLRSLSPSAPQEIHHVRLEAAGAGLTVTYAEHGAEASPELHVQLQGFGPKERKR